MVDTITNSRSSTETDSIGADEHGIGLDPLLRVIRDLDESDRELMLMTGWFEMTPSEIATVLGAEPGTIRVRLHRLRRQLAQQLDATGETGASA